MSEKTLCNKPIFAGRGIYPTAHCVLEKGHNEKCSATEAEVPKGDAKKPSSIYGPFFQPYDGWQPVDMSIDPTHSHGDPYDLWKAGRIVTKEAPDQDDTIDNTG